MNFNSVLQHIGEFGKYQKILYLIICLPGISCGIVMTFAVILLGEPIHRCKLPEMENDTYSVQSEYHELAINRYIPRATGDDVDLHTYDQCHRYVITDATKFDNDSRPINASQARCTSWVYDDTVFTETFLSKHDLICEDAYKASTAKTIFYGGVLVGALIFGTLSDYIGRRKTFCSSLVLLFASSLSVAWAPNYIAYIVMRFIVGMAFSGTFIVSYVIGVEIVGPTQRKFTGIANEFFFAFGECTLAGIGYFVRHWKYVEIIVAAPMVLFLTYWFFLPESPRWLINQGRLEEAEVIVRRASKVNKADLPEKLFDKEEKVEKAPAGKLWQLISTPVLFIRSMIILFNWLVVSMTYYGLTLNSGNLSGDIYLNFFFSGLVEFPAYILTILLLDRLGRKMLHCGAMLVGGVACLCTIFTIVYGGKDLQPLTTTLAMIGKFGSSAGFAIIYIFSAELFPTSVRNAGIGVSSMAARVGGMIAPLIADSTKLIGGHMGSAMPLIIFGSASVVAGLLTLMLPETLHMDLPETIEEAKMFGTPAYKEKKLKAIDEVIKMDDITIL